jgi:hypothetical protein
LFSVIKKDFTALFEALFELDKTEPDALRSLKHASAPLFNYARYCLPSIKIVDLNILLTFWKKKIESDHSSCTALIPFIDRLKSQLQRIDSKPFNKETFFADNDFFFIDEGMIKAGDISGCCIWFPKNVPKVDLFQAILDPNANNDLVPSFIEGTRYVEVFNKFRKRFDD